MSNYGRRAFCFAGPHVWNSLPEHIRQSTSIAVFKRLLYKDISTPADIAPSTLETIIFYCLMGYISALTYYLSLITSISRPGSFDYECRKPKLLIASHLAT